MANQAPPIAFSPERCEQLHFCVTGRCLVGTPNPVYHIPDLVFQQDDAPLNYSNVYRIALKSPNIRNCKVLLNIFLPSDLMAPKHYRPFVCA